MIFVYAASHSGTLGPISGRSNIITCYCIGGRQETATAGSKNLSSRETFSFPLIQMNHFFGWLYLIRLIRYSFSSRRLRQDVQRIEMRHGFPARPIPSSSFFSTIVYCQRLPSCAVTKHGPKTQVPDPNLPPLFAGIHLWLS